MIGTAQGMADRLRDWAMAATEMGHAKGCTLQLRVESDGLLIVALPLGGDRHAARLVPWSDVLAFGGAVTAAMDEVAAGVERKAR